MISGRIIEFIEEMSQLKAIGCLKAPKASIQELISELGRASEIIGRSPSDGKIYYQEVHPDSKQSQIQAPCLFIIQEEEYDSDPQWAAEIKLQVSYFLNVS